MDERVSSLTPWQRNVYHLCWSVGTAEKGSPERKSRAAELERLKKEDPAEFEKAFKVWVAVMYDTIY